MTQRVGGYWLNWLRDQGPAGIALAHMLGETESMSDFCQVSQQVAEFASENVCKWPDADVPWTLVKLLPDKTEAQLKALLQPAFSKWDRVKVRYVERSVDARVLVGCRHIDGQNGILADCYLPCGGVTQVRLQFDTGDHWDEEKFQQVAWHEFGHALGLGHAPQSSPNIMAPYLNMQQRSLGQWDRDEQAKRYPAAQPPSSPPTTGGTMGGLIGIFDLLQKIGPIVKLIQEFMALMENPAFKEFMDKIKLLFGGKQSLAAVDQNALADELETLAKALRQP